MSKVGVYNNRGFTLIELAMVIVVIGIIAAVIMPRFGNLFERQQLRRSINVVRGTVRYLQARAALTKHVYRLTFDLDNQKMSACSLRPGPEGLICQEEVNDVLRVYTFPKAIRLLDVMSPEGEKTGEGEAITHFHPTGLADPSTIHLSTDTNRQATVMIAPLGGTVKVLDGYVEPGAG